MVSELYSKNQLGGANSPPPPPSKIGLKKSVVAGQLIMESENLIQRCDFQEPQVKVGEPNVIHGDHAVDDNQYDTEKVEVGSNIGCLYDQQWFVGLVQYLSFEQNF